MVVVPLSHALATLCPPSIKRPSADKITGYLKILLFNRSACWATIRQATGCTSERAVLVELLDRVDRHRFNWKMGRPFPEAFGQVEGWSTRHVRE